MKQPDLPPKLFKYRVMLDGEIVGQFSNIKLADETIRHRRGDAIVLDVSVQPAKVVYENRKWIGEPPE